VCAFYFLGQLAAASSDILLLVETTFCEESVFLAQLPPSW
jgi:hypothetical protein